MLDYFGFLCYYIQALRDSAKQNIRVWRSLVSRLNGVQEASSSNLDTRTKTEDLRIFGLFCFPRTPKTFPWGKGDRREAVVDEGVTSKGSHPAKPAKPGSIESFAFWIPLCGIQALIRQPFGLPPSPKGRFLGGRYYASASFIGRWKPGGLQGHLRN